MEQPAVALGALATTTAVLLAAKLMRNGEKIKTQVYFRYRVVFQAITIVLLVAGGVLFTKQLEHDRKTKEDELRAKAKQRDAWWIEELERRDAQIQSRKRRLESSREELRGIAKVGFQEHRDNQRLELKNEQRHDDSGETDEDKVPVDQNSPRSA